MELLYFDFDHGVERLLYVRLDPESQSVRFRFEQGPDATYDEESEDVPVVSVNASTTCSTLEQFFGFCHALVAAMRETPFSLQDPEKRPFAAMPHKALVLKGIGDGVSREALTCRIPREISAELFAPDRVPAGFKPLVAGQD